MYELTAADMVVRQLDELSFINLKQLFRLEHMVGPQEVLLLSVSFSPEFLLVSRSISRASCHVGFLFILGHPAGASHMLRLFLIVFGELPVVTQEEELQEELEEDTKPMSRTATLTMNR